MVMPGMLPINSEALMINPPFSFYTLSATLSFALRARGLFCNSAGPGVTGCLVMMLRTFSLPPQAHCGRDGGQLHALSIFLKPCLTILSSNEWKAMQAILPPRLSRKGALVRTFSILL